MATSGNGHRKVLYFEHPPQRVVSLVPSLTESLFELGLGQVVVGVTDYCLHPADGVAALPRIGGPKNPRLGDILALEPDLVLANQEENTRQAVEALEAAGVRVLVSFPKTARQALDLLWAIIGIYMDKLAAVRLETLELALEWSESALEGVKPVRCFCPIWQGGGEDEPPWWMTFNRDTYCHDVLRLTGGENVFADRNRRYPLAADLGLIESQEAGERDTRYPRLTLEEIIQADPQVILLPDEPFAFSEGHQAELARLWEATSAVQEGRIHRVEGSLITWHGTRLARALRELPVLFAPIT